MHNLLFAAVYVITVLEGGEILTLPLASWHACLTDLNICIHLGNLSLVHIELIKV